MNPRHKELIDKYTKDQTQDESYDPSEDPEIQESDNLDTFGFFHPDGLSKNDIAVEEKLLKHANRLKKWQKMVQIWPKLFKSDRPCDKIMLTNSFQHSNYLIQIDLDIERTFRNSTFFRQRYNQRQQSLFRVLAAYSVYDHEVGYCQGMSEIVGLLLTYIPDEEDVFWSLVQLMFGPKHHARLMFQPGFPRLLKLFEHHQAIVKKCLPRLSKHLDRQQLEPMTYAFKWFMQCFIGRLPHSLVIRLWDIYLLVGERVLIAMAYNILRIHQKRLLKMDQQHLGEFFQESIPNDFIVEDDVAISSLKECFEKLYRVKLILPASNKDDELSGSLPSTSRGSSLNSSDQPQSISPTSFADFSLDRHSTARPSSSASSLASSTLSSTKDVASACLADYNRHHKDDTIPAADSSVPCSSSKGTIKAPLQSPPSPSPSTRSLADKLSGWRHKLRRSSHTDDHKRPSSWMGQRNPSTVAVIDALQQSSDDSQKLTRPINPDQSNPPARHQRLRIVRLHSSSSNHEPTTSPPQSLPLPPPSSSSNVTVLSAKPRPFDDQPTTNSSSLSSSTNNQQSSPLYPLQENQITYPRILYARPKDGSSVNNNIATSSNLYQGGGGNSSSSITSSNNDLSLTPAMRSFTNKSPLERQATLVANSSTQRPLKMTAKPPPPVRKSSQPTINTHDQVLVGPDTRIAVKVINVPHRGDDSRSDHQSNNNNRRHQSIDSSSFLGSRNRARSHLQYQNTTSPPLRAIDKRSPLTDQHHRLPRTNSGRYCQSPSI